MAEPYVKYHDDFSGGMNLGPQPYGIGPTEASSLVNLRPTAKGLRMRGGWRELSNVPYQPNTGVYSDITSIQPWRGGDPSQWDMFVGAEESIGRWDYTTGLFQRVPRAESPGLYLPYGASTHPWTSFQYKQILYFFRPGVGMRRISRAPLLDMLPGILPPPAAPTLADGGAGAIPAASFKGYVTFYNALTDAESNPSPASTTLALGANRRIAWTNLPTTATSLQVTHIRLYRTLPDEVAGADVQGYLVVQLPIGTATYSDNFLVEELGGPNTFDNDVPPTNLRTGVIWQERLWASDGKNLYVSPIGRPESLPATNLIAVFPDDGQDIVGVAADETRLYVGKTGSVIYFTGSFPNVERNTLDAKNGVVSQHTMQAVSGRLFWRSPTDVLVSEGGPGRSLAPGRQLRTYMENAKGALSHAEVATVIPNDKVYCFIGRFNTTFESTLKHPHAVHDRDILVYDYETGAWSCDRMNQSGGTFNTVRTIIDWEGQERVFGGYGPFLVVQDRNQFYDDVPNRTVPPVLQEIPIDVFVYGVELQAPPGFEVYARDLTLDSLLQATDAAPSNRFFVNVYVNGQYDGIPDIQHCPPNNVPMARRVRVFNLKDGIFKPGSSVLVGFQRAGIAQALDVFGWGYTGMVLARRHRRE